MTTYRCETCGGTGLLDPPQSGVAGPEHSEPCPDCEPPDFDAQREAEAAGLAHRTFSELRRAIKNPDTLGDAYDLLKARADDAFRRRERATLERVAEPVAEIAAKCAQYRNCPALHEAEIHAILEFIEVRALKIDAERPKP